MRRHLLQTVSAHSTRRDSTDDDGVADLEAMNAGTNLINDADTLVAEHSANINSGNIALQDVKISS